MKISILNLMKFLYLLRSLAFIFCVAVFVFTLGAAWFLFMWIFGVKALESAKMVGSFTGCTVAKIMSNSYKNH